MAEILFDSDDNSLDTSDRGAAVYLAEEPDRWTDGTDLPPAGESAIDAARSALAGVDDLDADATLAEAGEVQRLVNLVAARQLRLAARWADLHAVLDPSQSAGLPGMERLVHLGGAGTPLVAEFCCAELGAQLGRSPTTAAMLMGDALDLRHRMPQLWQLLCAGDVTGFTARQVATRTRHLSLAAAAQVDARVARYASTIPWGRLEPVVDAAVMAADPDAARAAAEQARDRQGVWVSRKADHGDKTLIARANGVDVDAFDTMVDDIATALGLLGDTDSEDVRRAKAIGILASTDATREILALAAQRLEEADGDDPQADPTQPGRPRRATPRQRTHSTGRAVVYVHLSQQALAGNYNVARIEDLGPIIVEQVQQLLGHRNVVIKPVVDLNKMRSVDAYEVPEDLAEAVHLRTPADCFPYGVSTSRRAGDIDHTDPYVLPDRGGTPGQTRLSNLGRLQRFHHRVKTFGNWRVKQVRSGVWLWTSPRRYRYLVDSTGTTALGRF